MRFSVNLNIKSFKYSTVVNGIKRACEDATSYDGVDADWQGVSFVKPDNEAVESSELRLKESCKKKKKNVGCKAVSIYLFSPWHTHTLSVLCCIKAAFL